MSLLVHESVIGIFGTGGQGRTIAWTLSGAGVPHSAVRFLVDAELRTTDSVDGAPVLSTEEFSSRFPSAAVFVGVGDPAMREEVVLRLAAAGHRFPSAIWPHAAVAPSARIGTGVLVCANATVSVDTDIGDHVHVGLNASVSHDVSIGAFTSLAPAATVCGHVAIGRGVHVGAGATIINGRPADRLTIGDGVLIAAGACVTRSLRADERVGGVPARPLGRRLPVPAPSSGAAGLEAAE